MKRIVFDTNILIDNVHGHAQWLNALLEKPTGVKLVIPTIVVAEYFTAQEFEKEDKIRESEEYLALFEKQELTEDIAKILGTILRRKTYVSSANTADLIVASTALYLDARLATNNKRDFAKIPDLLFFDPD